MPPRTWSGWTGWLEGKAGELAALVEDDQPVVLGEVVYPDPAGEGAGESVRHLVHRLDCQGMTVQAVRGIDLPAPTCAGI